MEYRPGICNIGWKNRLGRLGIGLFFFCVGVWVWALIAANNFPSITRLFMLVPFYLGFLGIAQALAGFCVHHARLHRFDMR